jgi:hypothetical protein
MIGAMFAIGPQRTSLVEPHMSACDPKQSRQPPSVAADESFDRVSVQGLAFSPAFFKPSLTVGIDPA